MTPTPSLDEISLRLNEALKPSSTSTFSDIDFAQSSSMDQAKPAAVLIPLFIQNDAWHVLFTRRNNNLPEHSGQVAFPGGRVEENDHSSEETALRESYEEIGLCPQQVRILGRLNEFITITNYLVTPIVGAIPWPYDFHLENREVSRIFSIPLKWLADPANHEKRSRKISSNRPPVSVFYFQPYDGEILWGISARLMLRLIEVLDL